MRAAVSIRADVLPALLAAAAGLASCGGGGGGGGGDGGTPPALNIVVTSLNDGAIGVPYNQVIVATGGTGQKTFTVEGALPAGLRLGSGGGFSGSPDGPAGTATFTVRATDSGSPAQTDTQEFSIRVADRLVIDAGSVPLARVGEAYSHDIAVTGGTLPYTILASLPAGLAIDAAGHIGGTPAFDATTSTGGLTVVDSATPPQDVVVDLRVRVALEVATTTLPDATGGHYYSANVQVRGGLPTFTWEMTGGNIPFLFRNGFIDGTPDPTCAPSTSTLDVTVTDSDSPAQSDSAAGISLTVNPGELAIPATAAPPIATVGQPYDYGIAVMPGKEPYAFSVAAGTLPAGIALGASTGRLSGTATTSGTSNFSVRVDDDCGAFATRNFSLIVRDVTLGRNDSIATATPIGNGTLVASISPSGHPNSVFSPDQDYFVVSTTAPSTITVDLDAVSGEIDTVVELVNAAGTRLQLCGAPAYNSECMNDDQAPGNLDSYLELRIGGPATFYVHVAEFRGDARPDLRYRLFLTGIQ